MFDGLGQDACTTWGSTGVPEQCQGIFTDFRVQNVSTGDAYGILDLSGVYQLSAGIGVTVHRGITLKTQYTLPILPEQNQDWIGIRDEIGVFTASNITWNFHTFANVTLVTTSSLVTKNILRVTLSATTPTGIPQSLDMVIDTSECMSAVLTSVSEMNSIPNLTMVSVTGYQNNCTNLSIVFGLSPIPDSAPTYLQSLNVWSNNNNPWNNGG